MQRVKQFKIYSKSRKADELVKGEVVRISNFGVLEAKVHKARSGTNPRTGEPLTIPEMKLIGFKTALTLKAKLNK